MPDPVVLRPDGPHSPAYTQQVANALAEAVRTLVYATRADDAGLEYPADAERLLAALHTATGRLPQLFAQLEAFLDAQLGTGRLGADRGLDPVRRVGSARVWLGSASQAAANLTADLQKAQNATAVLYVKDADA
jgi:hypothetical protein